MKKFKVFILHLREIPALKGKKLYTMSGSFVYPSESMTEEEIATCFNIAEVSSFESSDNKITFDVKFEDTITTSYSLTQEKPGLWVGEYSNAKEKGECNCFIFETEA